MKINHKNRKKNIITIWVYCCVIELNTTLGNNSSICDPSLNGSNSDSSPTSKSLKTSSNRARHVF